MKTEKQIKEAIKNKPEFEKGSYFSGFYVALNWVLENES